MAPLFYAVERRGRLGGCLVARKMEMYMADYAVAEDHV